MAEIPSFAATAAERPEKKAMFRKEASVSADTALITDNLNNLVRRLRLLEERQITLRRKTQVTDQNMLEHHKKVSADIKFMSSEIIEIKKELFDIKSKLRMVIRELQNSAKREDVQVIKKYLNLWEPMNFVTQKEVEDIVKSIIEDQKNK